MDLIPVQWPASRLGEEIAYFVPEGDAQRSIDTSAGRLDVYDRDGDQNEDLWVQWRRSNDRLEISSVRFTEPDGSFALLWSDEGAVYWEQRWDDTGAFENSFDEDRNGFVDDVRRGSDGCVEDGFRLDQSAAAQQPTRDDRPLRDVATDKLLYPHAILGAGAAIHLVYDVDIEFADATVRIPWAELRPAVRPDTIKSATIAVGDRWVTHDTEVTVWRDEAGFSLRATNISIDVWMGNAPLLELRRPNNAPEFLAVVSPRVIYDTTENQRASLHESVDVFEVWIERYEQVLARAQGFIADPQTILTGYEQSLADRESEVNALSGELDALRPEAAERWTDADVATQRAALELLTGGELTQAEDAALTELLEGFTGRVSAEDLPDTIRDLAFGSLFQELGESSHPFLTTLLELRLAVDALSNAIDDDAERRAERLRYYEERRDYAVDGIEEANAGIRDAERELTLLAAVPHTVLTTTRHSPHTY